MSSLNIYELFSETNVGEIVPHLVMGGNKLPPCNRGLQAELVEIKTKETDRVFTTNKPIVEEEVYEGDDSLTVTGYG